MYRKYGVPYCNLISSLVVVIDRLLGRQPQLTSTAHAVVSL